MTLYSEIMEQPQRVNDLLRAQRANIEKIAAEIKKRDIRFAFLAARGTSDNAARYANYLLGSMNRIPLALATPSLFTYYRQPPLLRDALVMGISQSGQSPDIISVLEEGKRQGCLTIAITNEPDSPLATTADFAIDIQAGDEQAVAATKTYTTQLMAVAMLATALDGGDRHWQELDRVADWMKQSLQLNDRIAQIVPRFRYIDHTVVLGRGFNYCTAFEWALKLKELTYTVAVPYSFADFQHGPIALVERGFPVMVISPLGEVYQPSLEMLSRLKQDFHAELVIISNDQAALDLAKSPITMPGGIPEWLTPLVSILPAQLFTYHLTVEKGYDTEQPRSIHKITETN
jgi:glucosamine--fructose-6-phosphate aminotransferase (isomerizing)